jgi:hypothetical protein
VLPQVLPLFLSYVLHRLETNIRAATVLGFVGAGGSGCYLQTYLRMIDYAAAFDGGDGDGDGGRDFVSPRLRDRLVSPGGVVNFAAAGRRSSSGAAGPRAASRAGTAGMAATCRGSRAWRRGCFVPGPWTPIRSWRYGLPRS